MVADPQYDGMFHLGGCDSRKTYAIEWDFTSISNSSVFRTSGGGKNIPTIQLAFSYIGYGIDPRDGVEKIMHKLRIHTQQLPVATSVNEIYRTASAETLIGLLTHQAVHTCLERGLDEGREAIKEWLVNFLTCYNTQFPPSDDTKQQSSSSSSHLLPSSSVKPHTLSTLDMNLWRTPSLSFLPRFVFALLKHPLLAVQHTQPDMRVYLQCLFRSVILSQSSNSFFFTSVLHSFFHEIVNFFFFFFIFCCSTLFLTSFFLLLLCFLIVVVCQSLLSSFLPVAWSPSIW